MRAAHHVAAAVPLGLAVGLATGSAGYALIAATASVLIDCDHVPDYVLQRGGWYGVRDFFATCDAGNWRRLYLILHSWELPIALGLGWLAGLTPPWLAAVGLGMAYHLAFDQVGNPVVPCFYWFGFRLAQGFDAACFFDPQRLAAVRERCGKGG